MMYTIRWWKGDVKINRPQGDVHKVMSTRWSIHKWHYSWLPSILESDDSDSNGLIEISQCRKGFVRYHPQSVCIVDTEGTFNNTCLLLSTHHQRRRKKSHVDRVCDTSNWLITNCFEFFNCWWVIDRSVEVGSLWFVVQLSWVRLYEGGDGRLPRTM